MEKFEQSIITNMICIEFKSIKQYNIYLKSKSRPLKLFFKVQKQYNKVIPVGEYIVLVRDANLGVLVNKFRTSVFFCVCGIFSKMFQL